MTQRTADQLFMAIGNKGHVDACAYLVAATTNLRGFLDSQVKLKIIKFKLLFTPYPHQQLHCTYPTGSGCRASGMSLIRGPVLCTAGQESSPKFCFCIIVLPNILDHL